MTCDSCVVMVRCPDLVEILMGGGQNGFSWSQNQVLAIKNPYRHPRKRVFDDYFHQNLFFALQLKKRPSHNALLPENDVFDSQNVIFIIKMVKMTISLALGAR